MKTITLSPSQYRVVHRSVECSSECSSTARASRMSQSQATAPDMLTNTKRTNTTNHHPIYGIVNLALLSVSIYLLWANF